MNIRLRRPRGFTFVEIQSNYYSPFFLTVKYDPAGNRLWERTWAQTASAAQEMVIDGLDNVIVAGSTHLGDDWATIKYDANGDQRWLRIYEANSYYLTEPDDLAVDAAGNVYLTGDAAENPSGSGYAHTVKYDSQGNLQWISRYAGPEYSSAGAALAIDDAGNVYVAGATMIASRGADLSLVKLDSAGSVQWLRTYGAPGRFTLDRAEDVAIDGAGDIVVTGFVGGNTTERSDVATLKFDPEGNLLWDAVYNAPASLNDYGTQLVIGVDDAVIVIGDSEADYYDY